MTKTSNTFSLGIGSEISLKDFSFLNRIVVSAEHKGWC